MRQGAPAPNAEPVAPAPNAEPVAPARNAEPVAPAPNAEPVAPARNAEPVAPARNAEPVAPAPNAEPVAPAPNAEPVAPAPNAEPVAPARNAEPVAPAPNAEPVADQRRPRPTSGRTRTIRTAAVAAAVVVGVVASMLSARTIRRGLGPVPPASPGATPGGGTPDATVGNAQGPYTIVYGDPGIGITIAPPGAGADRYFALATLDSGPLLPVTIGAAFVAGGTAYVLARPFVGAPRPIGKADRIFLTRAGFVGLERDGPTIRTGQDVGLDGSAAGDPFALPPGYDVVGRVPTGVVVWQAAGHGSLRVWMPPEQGASPGVAGRFVRTLGEASAVIGVHGDTVAWLASAGCGDDGGCPLHIADAESGGDHTVAPPSGRTGFLRGGAFSPDGVTLATFVADPLGAHLTLVRPQVSISPGRGPAFTATRVDGGLVQTESPAATAVWTPDGTEVFFCGVNGAMHVLRIGDAAAAGLDQPSSSTFAVF